MARFAEGLSGRAIASSQGMSRKSITAVLEAADSAGVSWDDVAERPEGEVYALLFPWRGEHESVFAQPDWDQVHKKHNAALLCLARRRCDVLYAMLRDGTPYEPRTHSAA